MAEIDKKYRDLLREILAKGYRYEDPNRKGVSRVQINSHTIKHAFKDGFPAITTKKLAWKSVVGELLWILRGDDSIKYLIDNNIPIWNKDAYNFYVKSSLHPVTYDEFVKGVKLNKISGSIGRGYGQQLRNYQGVDQLKELVETLSINPMATKKTVTFWNPREKERTALTPCHWSFEALVRPLSENERKEQYRNLTGILYWGTLDDYKKAIAKKEHLRDDIPKYGLTIKWNQHSVDTFLGLPFNIASYALLCKILAYKCNMVPEGIEGNLSNVHIYENHLDQVKEQLSRDVTKYNKSWVEISPLAKAELDLVKIQYAVDNLEIDNFILRDYKSYPTIRAEMLAYNK